MNLSRQALKVRRGSVEQMWIEGSVEEGFHPCCQWKGGGSGTKRSDS